MSDDLENTKKDSLAEVTDDSCTVEFIEIVPLDRASDDYEAHEFIHPVVVLKLEDLLDVGIEAADENDNEDANYPIKQELADDYETVPVCFFLNF